MIEAIANAPAGGVYLAGDFSSVHGVPRSRVARLLPDGEVDTSFSPREGPDADVTALAVQPDGKVLIAGAFTNVAGTPLLQQTGPFWFNSPTFVRSLGSESIVPSVALARQPDGVLVLAGAFDSVSGEPRRRLARVDPGGSLRGRLLLELSAGTPLRLSLPAEVESPYVLETSPDLAHWSAWLQDDYPWWPVELWLTPSDPARYFRARPTP